MPQDKDVLKDFKWIQEETSSERPKFEENVVPVNRTLGSILLKKFSENALVPIGILATTACLVMGLASMQRGNIRQQQVFMRGRVMFQAMTFLAMGSGVVITAMQRKKKKKHEREEGQDRTNHGPQKIETDGFRY